jgi:hypothetical protein
MSRPLAPAKEGLRKTASTYVYRAACAHLRAYRTGGTPIECARELYDDPVTNLLLTRSPTGPAAIGGTPTWASSLGGVAIWDMVADAATYSAAAELITRALKMNMDGISEYRIPGTLLSAQLAGTWAGEGLAAPVKQMSFGNAALLHPKKLEVRYAYTREQQESSNIESVVRATLSEAVGLALDLQMLSTDAGDLTNPPGIFVNSDTLTPSAGGGLGALDKDLEQLFGALASHSAGRNPVIVAAVPQAIALKRNVGPRWDIDVLPSTALASGSVGAIEISSLVTGFESTPEFSVTRAGLLHMEDTSPQDITGGTPSPAVPVRSMFQVEALGLKMSLWCAWGLRAAGHAQLLKAVTW